MAALFAIGLGSLSAPIGAAPDASANVPAPPSAVAVAALVQAFYAQLRTFSSDFKQEFTVKAYDKKETRAGHVVFEKPGKMSWRYADQLRVVSDGQMLKMYDPNNQQLLVQPLAGTQYPAALTFLMGQGNLTQSFDFQLADPKKPLPGTLILEGIPKTASTYQKVLFYVDEATSQVRKIALVDAQHNVNVFEFINPVVNVPSPAGEFTFTPPPGTRVVP
jgi:outer membrane lipoprotein carrier protein